MTSSEDSQMPSNLSTNEVVDLMRQAAKQYNLAIATLPVCPACEEYGNDKPLCRMVTIMGKVSVESQESKKTVYRDGLLILLCEDCKPNPAEIAQKIQFWSSTGFAHLFYVDS